MKNHLQSITEGWRSFCGWWAAAWLASRARIQTEAINKYFILKFRASFQPNWLLRLMTLRPLRSHNISQGQWAKLEVCLEGPVQDFYYNSSGQQGELASEQQLLRVKSASEQLAPARLVSSTGVPTVKSLLISLSLTVLHYFLYNNTTHFDFTAFVLWVFLFLICMILYCSTICYLLLLFRRDPVFIFHWKN